MTQHTFTLLDGTAKRNSLNVLNVLRAENNPIGQWVEHTTSTPIPAQNSTNSVPSPFNGYAGVVGDSPWAYGNHLHPITGSTYFCDSGGDTYGTDLLVLSIFVHVTASNLPANFTLGLESTTGTAQTHGHRFAWSASQDTWVTSINFGGARGYVDPIKYDGGWRRVCVFYQVGWDTGASDTTVSGDTYGTFFYPDHSTECDIWGQMLERRTAVTAGSTAYITALAQPMVPQPYLAGIRSEGTLTFEPPRAQYGAQLFQASMRTTPDAGLGLLRRVHPAAPWELCETARVEGNMNADGTVSRTITAAPFMRLAITELNNTTTTLGAWYTE